MVLGIVTGCGININQDVNENNVDKYSFSINEKNITLPCKLEDILNLGFTVGTSDLEKLETASNIKTYIRLFYDEELALTAYILPNGSQHDVDVVGIQIYDFTKEVCDVNFNGLVPGKSTLKDITKKYGEPTELEETTYTKYLIYSDQGDLLFTVIGDELTIISYINE